MKIVDAPLNELAEWVPWPAADANKYTRGKLVAVGGATAYPGAICMASTAALRMGAGYVEVVCAPETLAVVHVANPDLVARSWEGWTPAASKLDVPNDGRHPCACLVGSGMDAHDEAMAPLVEAVLRECAHPVLVDGGAITVLASEEGRAIAAERHARGLATVVTPHFGETERLAKPCGIDIPDLDIAGDEDLAAYALAIADTYGATVVLKGPRTFVASPAVEGAEPVVGVMTHGTAALAKAGTGDVLAGMTSALLAQGVEAWKAGVLAANLHAFAGRAAARRLTEVCVCATDVVGCIGDAVREVCGVC